ncbi:MAG: hypothetical protein NZ581_07930 [Candidatus Caldarchaeum sp.]|nr:hypothetical protein [Candidatus Caldarchaeum sp.]MDW8436102.1 hypothetical protein [Candidatus Caldarchaeum sp.]
MAKTLSLEDRKILSYRMFNHVRKTCIRAGLRPVVVTADPFLLSKFGGVPDEGEDLNIAINKAIRLLDSEEFFIILPDLPLLQAKSLQTIIDIDADYVVCPDLRMTGTNIVYVKNFKNFKPMFGENSFLKHLRQSAKAKIFYELGTALDIDYPSDLSLLRLFTTGFPGEK